MTVTWKLIEDHPKLGHNAPRVLVWGKKIGTVEMGKVFHYPEGYLHARPEGYHGDWEVTHWAEIPAPPTPTVTSDNIGGQG